MFLEFPEATKEASPETGGVVVQKSRWTSAHSAILAGAVALVAVGVVVHMKRVNL